MDKITLSSPLKDALGLRIGGEAGRKARTATVGDLLRYYPRKYDQRGKLTDLAALVVGERATVWAKVVKVQERDLGYAVVRRNGGKGRASSTSPTCVIGDSQRQLTCTFFNQYHWSKMLRPGTDAMFSGKVTMFNRTLQMSSPSVAIVDDGHGRRHGDGKDALDVIESFPGGVIPVYPLVEGVTQTWCSTACGPRSICSSRSRTRCPTCCSPGTGWWTWRPRCGTSTGRATEQPLEAAQQRLRYDEALAVQLVLARRRADARNFPAEPCPRIPGGLLDAFDANLPFELTAGQREVGETIATDLATIHPMNRLLQGEVGSGKTVVALRAMLQVIDSGRQAVMLAPTEVLAAQHARSLRDVLGPLGRGGELGAPPEATAITLLTGSLPAKARKQALLNIASGQAGIVVGTHALLSEGVFFANLGLIVVDEQHRFGVEQRHALRSKHPEGNPPHVLVMTATPIPRTVAMTVFGDLDTSTLTELPQGPVADRHHRRAGRGAAGLGGAGLAADRARRWPRAIRPTWSARRSATTTRSEMFEDGSTFDPDADDGSRDRQAPAAGGESGGRHVARRPAGGSAAGRPARPAAAGREGRRDDGLRGR